MALWYYRTNGNEHGPVTEDELRAFLAAHSDPSAQFSSEGMSQWVFASEVEAILRGEKTTGLLPLVNGENQIQCRKCGSAQVHSGARGFRFWRGGIFGMSTIIITCLKCGAEFLPGGEPY